MTELHAHPWRAGLSLVSLCIGVLAVVAIFTVSEITSEVFVATAEQHDGRRVTVSGEAIGSKTNPVSLRAMLDAGSQLDRSGGAVALLATTTTLTGASTPELASANQPFTAQSLRLVAGRYDAIRRLPLRSGRWLQADSDYPPELVLNAPASELWGGVGTVLAVLASRDGPAVNCLVVGVAYDGETSPVLYTSLIAMSGMRPALLDHGQLTILLHHPGMSSVTFNEIGRRMATAGGGGLSQSGMQRTDTVDALMANLRQQRQAFLGTALLALIVSAIGILNIGLASIAERSRELVTRRAIGATRTGIVAQVLFSSVLIGLAGAAVAVSLAIWGVGWWVPTQIAPQSAIEPPGVPWVAVGWGLIAAAGTTLLGALIPAIVAGRLDVATVLRD